MAEQRPAGRAAAGEAEEHGRREALLTSRGAELTRTATVPTSLDAELRRTNPAASGSGRVPACVTTILWSLARVRVAQQPAQLNAL